MKKIILTIVVTAVVVCCVIFYIVGGQKDKNVVENVNGDKVIMNNDYEKMYMSDAGASGQSSIELKGSMFTITDMDENGNTTDTTGKWDKVNKVLIASNGHENKYDEIDGGIVVHLSSDTDYDGVEDKFDMTFYDANNSETGKHLLKIWNQNLGLTGEEQ